jgi:hypothetical protein
LKGAKAGKAISLELLTTPSFVAVPFSLYIGLRDEPIHPKDHPNSSFYSALPYADEFGGGANDATDGCPGKWVAFFNQRGGVDNGGGTFCCRDERCECGGSN